MGLKLLVETRALILSKIQPSEPGLGVFLYFVHTHTLPPLNTDSFALVGHESSHQGLRPWTPAGAAPLHPLMLFIALLDAKWLSDLPHKISAW